MITFFKRLFCRHNWLVVERYSYGSDIADQYFGNSLCVCSKCTKRETKFSVGRA